TVFQNFQGESVTPPLDATDIPGGRKSSAPRESKHDTPHWVTAPLRRRVPWQSGARTEHSTSSATTNASASRVGWSGPGTFPGSLDSFLVAWCPPCPAWFPFPFVVPRRTART